MDNNCGFVFETFSEEQKYKRELENEYSRFNIIKYVLEKRLKVGFNFEYGDYNNEIYLKIKKDLNINFNSDIDISTFKNAKFPEELTKILNPSKNKNKI